MTVFDQSAFLKGFWYLAVAGKSVRRGTTVPLMILGERLLIGRASDASVFAYRDRCPHRGMPMRHGWFDGEHLHCCYHGWKFSAADGACAKIPALSSSNRTTHSKFKLSQFPAAECQGNIWVYITAGRVAPDPLPELPTVPGFDGVAPQISTTMRFQSNSDVAAMGFCDPAHPPFVHTSRWWKTKAGLQLRPKTKMFEPVAYGFRMKQHRLGRGANPYRLLGTDVEVDVTILLPGIRIEHIRGSRHSACVLATATPVSTTATDVHYRVYWTVPWLWPFRPLANLMAQDFLLQDLEIAEKLVEDLDHHAMTFVGDADTQVAWFLRLKREYQESQAEGREFSNPVREQTLHWNS